MNGWHFSDETECLRYGDGRKIEVGVTHTVDCELILCESGLHASEHVLEALIYAPGPILWKVTLSGKIIRGYNKACATERTYYARLDATDILREFARKCALDVIHLWDAPEVVRQYIETGDEELRAAAGSAARLICNSTAMFPICRTNRVLGNSASWAAANSAARAAKSVAKYAAKYAAWASANAAAWASANSAARKDEWDAKKVRLDAMVKAAMIFST